MYIRKKKATTVGEIRWQEKNDYFFFHVKNITRDAS